MFKSSLVFILIFCIGIFAFYLLINFILPWLARKRFASQEMPESWERELNTKHSDFSSLSETNKEKVRKLLKVLMAEKFLEPDHLKWDEQIEICSIIAMKNYCKRHGYLSKLSTIRIGKEENLGQGLIEVPSIEALKELDYRRWF